MCRKHAEETARAADERGGLNGPYAGFELGFKRIGTGEDRALFYVFHDDAPAATKGRAANTLPLTTPFQKSSHHWGSHAGLRSPGRRFRVHDLDIAEIGAGNGYAASSTWERICSRLSS